MNINKTFMLKQNITQLKNNKQLASYIQNKGFNAREVLKVHIGK